LPARSIHQLHDVRRHRYEVVFLVPDLDLGQGPFLLALDPGDLVVDGQRVTEVDGLEKPDPVVTDRNHRPVEVLEDVAGGCRCVSDDERAMSDPMTQAGLAAVLLVDVVWIQVAGDTGEEIDVRLAHRLCDPGPKPDGYVV